MAEFDYRLTRFEPAYTFDDYGGRYDTGATAPKTPVQQRMEQEDRKARADRIYRRQAGSASEFLPGYLNQGLYEDFAEIRSAASKGDATRVGEIRDKIAKVADDYRSALVAWQNAGPTGGEFAEHMAKGAKSILEEDYLDTVQVTAPYGKKVALRDYVFSETPEGKKVARMEAARTYQVDDDAAGIISDSGNKYHSLLQPILEDLASGQALQMRKDTIAEGDSKVNQARSGLSLYAQHIAKTTAEDGSWGDTSRSDIAQFYRGAYGYLGVGLSAKMLDTLQRQYMHDRESLGDGFSPVQWFQARSSAMDRNLPREYRIVTDAEGKKRAEEVPVAGADKYAVLDKALWTAELLGNSSAYASTDVVESATGEQLARARQLERDFGVRLQDYGFADAASQAAASKIDADYADSNGHHAVIDRATAFGDRLKSAVGYADPAFGSSIHFAELGKALMSSGMKAYLKSGFERADSTAPGGSLDAAIGNAVTATLDEFIRNRGIKVEDDSFVREFAGRLLENMATGRSQSLQEIAYEMGDHVRRDPQTGEAVPVNPAGTLDPATGRDVGGTPRGSQVASGELGLFSTDPASAGSMKAEHFYRANAAMRSLADGTDPVLDGRPEAPAVRGMVQEILKVQDAQTRNGGGRMPTGAVRPYAAKVFAANLADAGIELPSAAASFLADSGRMLEYLNGDDKAAGWTSGEDYMSRQAVAAVNALAKEMASGGFQNKNSAHKAFVADMFARLSVEIMNRDNTGMIGSGSVAGRLLMSLGVPLSIISIPFSGVKAPDPISGSPAEYYRDSNNLNDKQAQEAYATLRKNLSQRIGIDISTDSVSSLYGYDWTQGIGEKQPSSVDYGRILRVWDANHRGQPPVQAAPDTPPDEPLGESSSMTVAAPAIDRRAGIRRTADSMLRNMVIGDVELAALAADLKRYAEMAADSEREAQAMAAQLVTEMERRYRRGGEGGGITAAKDYALEQTSRIKLYMPHYKVDSNGERVYRDRERKNPVLEVRPEFYSPEDFERLRESYGKRSHMELLDMSRDMLREWKADRDLDDYSNKLQIKHALDAQSELER